MSSGAIAARARRCVRVIFGLAISPFGYAKELVLCALLIGSASGSLSWLHVWWLPEETSASAASAALEHPAISRVMAAADGEEILLFRDFREVVAIDGSGEERLQFPLPSPEYLHLGSGDDGWSCLFLDTGRIIRWCHSALGEIPCAGDRSPEQLHDLSLSADGQTAAALFSRREIRIWQRTAGGSTSLRSVPIPHEVDKLFVSPRGRRIALRTADNLLEWMEPLTGKTIGQAHEVPMLPVCHAWSLDERWFAIGTDDRRIRVWSVDSQSGPAYTLHDVGVLFSLAFSDDGRWLVAGEATGKLFAWHDGRLAWSRPAHAAGIRGLDLSADGESIISGCMHGSLRIHSLKTGDFLEELPNERN